METEWEQIREWIVGSDRGSLRKLLGGKEGVGMKGKRVEGNSILRDVYDYGSVELLSWIVGEGVCVDQGDSSGTTTLMYAAMENRVDFLEGLLGLGADVLAKNDSGETALSYACTNDSLEAVELLLARGAEVNTVDRGGGTPLDWAVEWSRERVVELLIARGARRGEGGK